MTKQMKNDEHYPVELQALAIEKMRNLMTELNQKVLEREELIGLIMLALFSAQNMFLIGKPGVAKTKVLKLILDSVEGAISYEHLMMYDTKPEAIFGRTHIAPNGDVVHRFEHTAVTAHYILEDEFFKGCSEIINGYLGITSQNREYHPEGMEPIRVPLMSFFAASNEFPKGEALDAMNDRLPLRYEVKRIMDDDNFCAMVEGRLDSESVIHEKIPLEMLQEISEQWIKKVVFPSELARSYAGLKRRLVVEENIEASDRRLHDAVRIMRTSAYLNGRWEIDESDFFLLNHIIWNTYPERAKTDDGIKRHLFTSSKHVEKVLSEAGTDFDRLNTFKQAYLDDFLLKATHVPVQEMERYYETHIAKVRDLMEALNAAYGKIEHIFAIMKNNNRILELVRNNLFVPNQKDEVFIGDLPDRLNRCDEDFRSLYLYLDEFVSACPDVRAYKSYTGKKIAKT